MKYLFLIGGLVGVVATALADLPTAAEARALFAQASASGNHTPFRPTAHPGAQWFPKAGFGLFIHWGMCSQRNLRPSWGVLHNRFKIRQPRDIDLDAYYALADEFNPQDYDPDAWMEMAKSLGMQYAVLTTKHHDGYCLWPSDFGDYNTKNGAHGRDLVGEFVEAARRHGLKVGFYFSPRDWSYNQHVSGFPVTVRKFDMDNPLELPFSQVENRAEYLKWIDYTVGQLSELMTRYGQIDVLWFDGANWMGDVPNNEYGNKVRNWIYGLQPQIVINPRWGEATNPDYVANASANARKVRRAAGDFFTFESQWSHIVDRKQNEGVYEPIWFEFCDIWKGWHWGHDVSVPEAVEARSMHRILERLSTLRAFGGNYLLNVGPDRNGRLRSDIFAEARVLSEWIDLRRAAFFEVQPVKQWEAISPVPLTRVGNTLHVHLTGERFAAVSEIKLSLPQPPVSVGLLGKPEIEVSYSYDGRVFHLSLPAQGTDPLGEIVTIQFAVSPF